MAATDQTYRNQKTLDVVFGASCVAMLVVTVLMFWLDHDLPWKANQRAFRDVVPAVREREMLDKLPDPDAVYERRLAVDQARRRRDEAREAVAPQERQLTAERERQTAVYQGVKADYDSLMTYYNIDVEHWGHAKEGSAEKKSLGEAKEAKKRRLDELQKRLYAEQAKLDDIKARYDDQVLDRPLDGLPSPSPTAAPNGSAGQGADVPTLRKLEVALAVAEDELKKVTGPFDRYAKAAVQSAWGRGDAFRALPILDAFESPTKIKQIWLPELTIDYSFRDVPRFDRCTTCHLGIDQTAYDRTTLQALADVPEHAEVDRLLHELEQKNDQLRDLYRGPEAAQLIAALKGMDDLLAQDEELLAKDPKLRTPASYAGLRTQVQRAHDAWQRQSKGRLNALQKADHLYLVRRTLGTVSEQVARVKKDRAERGIEELKGVTQKLEAKLSEAQKLFQERQDEVQAVVDALNADALKPVRKLQLAGDMLKERQRGGEKLGFDPDDLPTRSLGSAPAVLGWGLFSLGLLFAGVVGYVRHSPKLGVGIGVLGTVVAVGAAAVVGRGQQKVYATRAVRLNEGQVAMFATHPRLDLFVGANSPHAAERFGCTICHGGQGSATDFQLASHTPNDAVQQDKWVKDHHWHSSHFWDFPMLPKRFVESSCVKCHHQLTDLIRAGNKEEAPKLLRGYNLVRENGCFGCHEIAGFKAGRSIGPDLRLEPGPALDYLTPAEQEKARADSANPPGALRKVGPGLRRLAEKTNQEWARRWVLNPRGYRPDTKMPHFYGLSNNDEAALKGTGQEKFPATEVHAIAHYLFAESKAHLEGKDTYRNALLKHVDGQSSLDDLQKQLKTGPLSDRELKELNDLSRRFGDLALLSAPERKGAIHEALGQQRQAQERLQELNKKERELRRKPAPESLGDADRADLERAKAALDESTAALLRAARPAPVSAGVVNENQEPVTLPSAGDAVNGRQLFSEKGCLACHSHEGTRTAQPGLPAARSSANFGPELSRIAAKIRPEAQGVDGRRWLIQWLLNPNVYHPRTRMPVTFLSPQDAADIAAWLLSQPVNDWEVVDPAKPSKQDLVALARVYLVKAPGVTAKELDERFPLEGKVKGLPAERVRGLARDADERRLVAKEKDGELSEDDLLWYVGRKSIGRLGCYACHDIPGFEAAKPIGTGLNDWGKKDPERLDFQDAAIWVREHFTIVDGRRTRRGVEDRIRALLRRGAQSLGPEQQKLFEELSKATEDDKKAPFRVLAARAEKALPARERRELAELRRQLAAQPRIRELEAKGEKALGTHERRELEQLRRLKLWDDAPGERPPYETAFYHALEHHTREGFLHNKLLEPRSYDFNRIKLWDDRLRMPQFRFSRTRKRDNENEADYQARQEKEEADAREAVMTFILGLVAEPIPEKYVHKPGPDRQAEVKGRAVLDKFNCAGCHQVRPGAYEFKASPDVVQMLDKRYGDEVRDKQKEDHVFPNHDAWVGAAPPADRLVAFGTPGKMGPDYSGPPVQPVRLTDALRYHGGDRVVRDLPAGTSIELPAASLLGKEAPPFGGALIDTLVDYLTDKRATRVVERYGTRFTDNENNARAALPPPLLREGERVQPDWLYQFLLNPTPVRPTSYMVLRMPRFNMSPEESRALANYFAAVAKTTNPGAGITYPYTVPKQSDDYWQRRSREYADRLASKLEPSARQKALEGKQEKDRTDAEKEELSKLQKELNKRSKRFEQLQAKGKAGPGLNDDEKKELVDLRQRSKLEARARDMVPIWEAIRKQELAEARAALKAAEKEAEVLPKDKREGTPQEQAVQEAKKKVEALSAEIAKKEFSQLRRQWQTSEVYAEDGYRLLTSAQLCLQCHSVGNVKSSNEQGPDLMLAARRLRPDWVEWWVAHPARMFPYVPVMPQNFKNEPDPIQWPSQDLFVGSPLQQVRASRDVLMDLRRVSDFIERRRVLGAAGGGR
jgi:mono/diheme cytochrome c family protein